MSDNEVKRLSAEYLRAASCIYESSCPQLARHLSSKFNRLMKNGTATPEHNGLKNVLGTYCSHCHSILPLTQCRVRLRPRSKVTAKVMQLCGRQFRFRSPGLTATQRKKVSRWLNSRNRLLICCSTCRRLNTLPCATRASRPQVGSTTTLHHPVRSHGKKRKRQSSSGTQNASSSAFEQTPRKNYGQPYKKQKRQSMSSILSTPSSGNTSLRVASPRPSQSSSPAVPRRSSRSAKDKFRQLQTLLKTAREEKSATDESPLAKFLTSL